jgi:hypothetical protein
VSAETEWEAVVSLIAAHLKPEIPAPRGFALRLALAVEHVVLAEVANPVLARADERSKLAKWLRHTDECNGWRDKTPCSCGLTAAMGDTTTGDRP